MANHTTREGIGSERALGAALAAPRSFEPRGTRRAQTTSERIVSRFAPEGEPAVRASRSLALMAFADRHATPYLHAAMQRSHMPIFAPGLLPRLSLQGRPQGLPSFSQFGADETSPLAKTSWVFPTPWYVDELQWLRAAQAGEHTPQPSPIRRSLASTAKATWSPLISHVHASLMPMMAHVKSARVVERSVVSPMLGYVSPGELVAALRGTDTERERTATRLRQSGPKIDRPSSPPQQGNVTPRHRVATLLAESLSTDPARVSPAAGPRVGLPSGIGSVAEVVSKQVARQTGQNESGPRGLGLLRLIETPPAALTHVAWSDRWLARFAGASETTMASFASPSKTSSVAPWSSFDPRDIVYTAASPERFDAETTDHAQQTTDAVAVSGSRRIAPAPVQGDDEVVSDEVFAMLARAAVQEPQNEAKPAPVRLHRPSLTDRLLTAPVFAPRAGVGPSLAASPAARGLGGTIGIEPRPPFDTRPLISADRLQLAPSVFVERPWQAAGVSVDEFVRPFDSRANDMAIGKSGAAGGPTQADSWSARPGHLAESMRQTSIARELASSDLSFDFVTPELAMASRTYGFDVTASVQAARLAVAGPAYLSSEAAALDHTLIALAVPEQRASFESARSDRGGGVVYVASATSSVCRSTSWSTSWSTSYFTYKRRVTLARCRCTSTTHKAKRRRSI